MFDSEDEKITCALCFHKNAYCMRKSKGIECYMLIREGIIK